MGVLFWNGKWMCLVTAKWMCLVTDRHDFVYEFGLLLHDLISMHKLFAHGHFN